MKKIILISITTVVVVAVAMYFFIYQSHRNVATEKATYTVTTSKLIEEFSVSDSTASRKYQDQIINCEGTITDIDKKSNSVVLDNKIYAVFLDSLPQSLLAKTKITLKGRFLGYDELLEEFKIDQCQIQNSK